MLKLSPETEQELDLLLYQAVGIIMVKVISSLAISGHLHQIDKEKLKCEFVGNESFNAKLTKNIGNCLISDKSVEASADDCVKDMDAIADEIVARYLAPFKTPNTQSDTFAA